MVNKPVPIGTVVLRLLELEHTLPPAGVPETVRREAEAAGLRDAEIMLVDRQQQVLTSLTTGRRSSVDGTLAGDAYRRRRPHTTDAENGHLVLVPLIDGEDRLGVFCAVVDTQDDERIDDVRTLSAMTASVIVSKRAYSDFFEIARRVEPMDVAAELRWSLLPPLTLDTPRVWIAGILEPAYDIAGDAFDYAVDGDVAHVAMFDAVGHGLRAARLATLATATYRNVRRQGGSIEECASAIDAVLIEQFGECWFVTAVIGTLDLTNGRFRWLNAGHPRPLLLRDGKVVATLEAKPGLPLGLGGPVPPVEEIQLQPDDAILHYSDGVTEARSDDGDFFGEERLADHLSRCTADGLLPAETLRRLVARLHEHRQPPLADDATLLLAGWRRA